MRHHTLGIALSVVLMVVAAPESAFAQRGRGGGGRAGMGVVAGAVPGWPVAEADAPRWEA